MAINRLTQFAASGAAGGGDLLAIEDVFSTYLYTGNGSTQTITNGIDLAGEGGLVWIKDRSSANGNVLVDSERGVSKELFSNSTLAEQTNGWLSSFNSDGFSIGSSSVFVNTSPDNYASWTFRKAPRFFDCVTWAGNSTLGRAISHNLGTTPGMIIVKWYDGNQNWAVWHRSLTAGTFLVFNGTNSAITNSNVFTTTSPTDSIFYVGNDYATNGTGANYVAYLFAHDPLGPSGDGSDGLIACGSYTGNSSSGSEPVINLGWEPQWLLVKNATTASNWIIYDTMRGWANRVGQTDYSLAPDSSAAENGVTGGADGGTPTATGFDLEGCGLTAANTTGDTHIYIAIRRGPMRAPDSGTEVFDVDHLSSSVSQNQAILTSGFPVDANIRLYRTGGAGQFVNSRMTGSYLLISSSTAAEFGGSSPADWGWDSNTGIVKRSSGTNNYTNQTACSFRRAPGFFDVVAYSGDSVAGRTVPHNLGVAPELMIVKNRELAINWSVYHAAHGADKYLILNSSGTGFTTSAAWNDTAPTDSVFTVGSANTVNANGNSIIAYLFATLPGVSKVGSYTGNGTSQTIDCGFTSGARFVLIKRTDSTGDWYVWDTERGIVAGNDPHLSLNSTSAEVTTDDTIDPDSSGFIVNQVAATNVNVSSASYIFLAIA